MSMKTVIQNFAKDLKKTMHNTESLFDLITAYLPKFEESVDAYSENEIAVGTWVNGKTIYQKTIDFGALPNNTTKTVLHHITNLDAIINISGVAVDNGTYQPLPIIHDTSVGAQTIIHINPTEIWIRDKYDLSNYNAVLTIQYTKS